MRRSMCLREGPNTLGTMERSLWFSQEVTEIFRRELGFKGDRGMVVKEVSPSMQEQGSPSKKHGVASGKYTVKRLL